MKVALLLHNIRSSHNVGSIFRTADGAGVAEIYLTGYTPIPVDRFGRAQKEIAKTALGAQQSIPWKYTKNPSELIKRLKNGGWRVVGIEQDVRAIHYRAFVPDDRPILFVLGNEVHGISRALRARCDELLEIPMRGKKESLNVSVATGIVLFAAADDLKE